METGFSIPLYNPGNQPPCHFMGFEMLQNRNAVPLWSYLCERLRPGLIIELGTYEGGFACVLAIMARAFRANFITYDHGDYNHPKFEEWFKLLTIDFRRADITTPATQEELKQIIQSGPRAFILCDNGNKESELKMVAPWLKPGDLAGAHDYYTSPDYWRSSEVNPEMFEGIIAEHDLHLVLPDIIERTAWIVYSKGQVDLC